MARTIACHHYQCSGEEKKTKSILPSTAPDRQSNFPSVKRLHEDTCIHCRPKLAIMLHEVMKSMLVHHIWHLLLNIYTPSNHHLLSLPHIHILRFVSFVFFNAICIAWCKRFKAAHRNLKLQLSSSLYNVEVKLHLEYLRIWPLAL